MLAPASSTLTRAVLRVGGRDRHARASPAEYTCEDGRVGFTTRLSTPVSQPQVERVRVVTRV